MFNSLHVFTPLLNNETTMLPCRLKGATGESVSWSAIPVIATTQKSQ